MSCLVPAAKLIYVVRDPIERLVSDYLHRVSDHLESRSMDVAFTDASAAATYLDKSRYGHQLGLYLDAFPRDQIRVVAAESLRARRPETLRGIFSFLGVDPDFQSLEFLRELHPTSGKVRPSQVARAVKVAAEATVGRYVREETMRRMGRLVYRVTGKQPLPKPNLPPDLRQRLEEMYRSDAAMLRKLTGMAFEGWSV
jgi:hypothetical protein